MMPAKDMRREAALAAGEPRYMGTPCKQGHSGERYTKSLHCCACKDARKLDPVWLEESRRYARERHRRPEAQEAARKQKNDPAYREQQRLYAARRREDPAIQEAERKRREDPAYKAAYRQWIAEQKQDPARLQKLQDTKQKHRTKRLQDEAIREADAAAGRVRGKAYNQSEAGRIKRNASNAKRRAFRLAATPAWADLEKIEQFYIERLRLERVTGRRHHVDHIIPLQGETVCGLHVENNLRIIPAVDNIRKKNRFAIA